ncbi:hypothetical protein B0H14DRAFT_2581339 [Mycena olivaceomarginata]|nr:hypothetical protein B0H14DRAFT_2581339 [Mycena olivaceomarginata]
MTMTLIALRTILTKTRLPPRAFTSTCPAAKTDADNLMAASLQYQQVLRRKGRMAARIISPFAHWGIVLSAGLKRDPSRDDEGSDRFTDKQVHFFLPTCHLLIPESRENELYQMFKALEQLLIPNIREELLRHGSQAAVMFATGCSYNANMKHEMGFRHPECGEWLCPVDQDWKDDGICQQLRDGRIVPGPADYNWGLYHGCDPDPNDLVSGFLRDDEIVGAYNHIFISPTTVLAENGSGNKSTGKGNAAQHEMSKATLESVYYVVHINTFQAAGTNGLFLYRKYFNFLQHSVRLWPEADQKSLLTWWNEKVFSHLNEAQPAKHADDSLSVAERMAAQAAAAKAALSRLESM